MGIRSEELTSNLNSKLFKGVESIINGLFRAHLQIIQGNMRLRLPIKKKNMELHSASSLGAEFQQQVTSCRSYF